MSYNDALTNLNALGNVNSINGGLYLKGNDALVNLNGLDSIASATITEVYISDNSQLFLCNAQSICNHLENGGLATIFNNAPGCNNIPEVETSCLVPGVSNTTITDSPLLMLFPNPTTDYLTIQQLETGTLLNMQIFDAQGRLALLANGQQIDVQRLAPGMYTLRAVVGERVFAGKFIKQ